MPTENKIATGLWLFENAFERSDCTKLCGELEARLDWSKSMLTVGAGKHFDPKYRLQSSLNALSFNNHPIQQLPQPDDYLGRWLRDYVNIGGSFLRLLNVQKPQGVSLLEYQRSQAGDFFDWHADNGHNLDRTLSMLTYLSDRESGLEGGETEWVVEGEVVTIEPQAGSIVVFDPNLIHRGCPVSSGLKFSALCIFKNDPQGIV